jgi:lactobin A/cerein 7B family class IIb bacteriocin
MKNLDLNKLNVQELNQNELEKTEGGSFLISLLIVAVCAIAGYAAGREAAN